MLTVIFEKQLFSIPYYFPFRRTDNQNVDSLFVLKVNIIMR